MSESVETMLREMAEAYLSKAGEAAMESVQFQVDDEVWHLIAEPGGQVNLTPGAYDPAHFTIVTDTATLRRIYAGEMTALTAAGRARLSEPAPLDFRLPEGVDLTPEIYAQLLDFLQHFFNRFTPERILLGEAHARPVHGALAVAMYYYPGFRSAWYTVKPGQRMNEEGDMNPFPQALVVLSGRGHAKIGEERVRLAPDTAYYVPPFSDHVVWADEGSALTLIWLAWGENA